jgi:hypothetical protein
MLFKYGWEDTIANRLIRIGELIIDHLFVLSSQVSQVYYFIDERDLN